jgi:phosphoribosylanthranilate isomerase
VGAVRIKICGLFRLEDAGLVNAAQPDYAGLVFAPSRRQVDVKTARAIRERLSAAIVTVGVFADADIAFIEGLYREGVISIAQLHGNEDDGYIRELKGRCGVPVIKAVRFTEDGGPSAVPISADSAADYLLFDSGAGTGRRFDWKQPIFVKLLQTSGRPWFLAGGINIGNIMEAVALKPFCIDVSSGAESAGLKDAGKVRQLVKAVRAISNEQ